MMSSLKPYIALILAILNMLLLICLWQYNDNKKFYFISTIILLISTIYILFPVKVIFSDNQENDFEIMPILYGLPTKTGWEKIKRNEYYPGGDVVNLLNPKYIISIRIK